MWKILSILTIHLVFIMGCSQPDTQALRLGTNVWPGYEPLYLARDLGELPPDQIKLVEYPSASEVIRAFRNRALEAASLTLDEVLLLMQDQIPVKVILVHDISNGADTILARPPISSIVDIKGKSVAVESSALGAYMISRALELNELKIEDINIYHMEVNAHEQAYLKKEVDVVVNFEPVRTRLLNKGANEIFTSKEIHGEIVDVLVVHEDVYNNRKKPLQQVVQAWFSALDYFQKNPDKAASIMARRLNVNTQEVIASFNGLEFPDASSNHRMLGGESPSLQKTAERLLRILKQNSLIREDLKIPFIFSAEFLKP